MRAILIALLPLGAQAACPQETYISCPLEGGKYLEVCISGSRFTYDFGSQGAPDLSLAVAMAAGTVTPWPGFGRSIWASVGFPNDDFTYEVWASVDRDPEAIDPSGGVNVLRGEEMIAQFTCRPGTVTAPAFVLEDAMAAQGFCWDFSTRTWAEGACG